MSYMPESPVEEARRKSDDYGYYCKHAFTVTFTAESSTGGGKSIGGQQTFYTVESVEATT